MSTNHSRETKPPHSSPPGSSRLPSPFFFTIQSARWFPSSCLVQVPLFPTWPWTFVGTSFSFTEFGFFFFPSIPHNSTARGPTTPPFFPTEPAPFYHFPDLWPINLIHLRQIPLPVFVFPPLSDRSLHRISLILPPPTQHRKEVSSLSNPVIYQPPPSSFQSATPQFLIKSCFSYRKKAHQGLPHHGVASRRPYS